jgi:hypothetical protein
LMSLIQFSFFCPSHSAFCLLSPTSHHLDVARLPVSPCPTKLLLNSPYDVRGAPITTTRLATSYQQRTTGSSTTSPVTL